MQGNHFNAYVELDKILNTDFKTFIDKLKSKPDVSGNIGNLYRFHPSKKPLKERKDLFHVPFQNRHLISTNRYSIVGIPCLYLAGSTYLCWEEMGRTPLDDVYASRFQINKEETLQVLNLGYRHAYFASFFDYVQINNNYET